MHIHSRTRFGFVLAVGFGLWGTSLWGADFRTPSEPGVLKVVSYNLENLFDTTHDHGADGTDKNDAEFLPASHPDKKTLCRLNQSSYYYQRCLKSDWNEARLQIKLDNIAEALSFQGDLPDLLGVQEIENANVAQRLAKRLGYADFVMTDSPDERGIDVALFFRRRLLTLDRVETLRLKLKEPTRDMLLATFDVGGGAKLTAVVVHWPSQSNPASARMEAAQTLLKKLNPLLARKNHSVVVMGDFNTTDQDTPNPYHNGMMTRMTEARRWAFSRPHPLFPDMPPGSYWYSKENVWNLFDTFFLSENLVDGKGVHAIPQSYRIIAADELMKDYGFNKSHPSRFFRGAYLPRVPLRYDHGADQPEKAGYSDHLPVGIQIRLQAPPAEE